MADWSDGAIVRFWGPRLEWSGDYARFRDEFISALDDRFYPIEYLDRLVTYGMARFWSNETAAIVTEVKTFPSGYRVIHGLIAAGDMDGIKSLIREAEEWSKSQGHIGAMIDSRSGWVRALKSEGYEIFQTAIFKEY